MIKKIFSLLPILFLGISATGQGTEAKKVQQSFETYKTAVLNDNGNAALQLIDSRTLKYYDKINDAIKNADSLQIEAMSLTDKLTLLSMRHRVPGNVVMSMNGNDLFVYAINHGMVGKNGISNNRIGEVLVDGNFAKGQLVVNGTKAPFFFHFYREESKWKLDLTSLFPITNAVFRKMVEDSGEHENDFIFRVLEVLTGKKPGPEIWQKLN